MVQRPDRYPSGSSHRYRQCGPDRKVVRDYDHCAAPADANADANADADTDANANANANADADADTGTYTGHCAIQRCELYKERNGTEYKHHHHTLRGYLRRVTGRLPYREQLVCALQCS